MRGLRTTFLHSVVSLGILCAAGLQATAVELQIPVSTPRLSGLSAEFPASEGTASLSASLRYDSKGKVTGEATIDGQSASVRGSLKKVPDGWTYAVTFKGLVERAGCKVSGRVGSGVATIKYKGARGSASLAEYPVSLEATQGESSGELSGSFAVNAKGKITGTGRFDSGLGNDPEGEGKVTGKVSLTSISLKFKSGKQTITFKGEVRDGYIVGTLKIKSPPAKETVESFSIPLDGSFSLPPQGGPHEPETEQFLLTINLEGVPGVYGTVTVNRVTTASGRIFNRAYVEASSGDFYYRNLEGIELDPNVPVPPTSPGRWISFPLELYNVNDPGHFKKSGKLTIDVTHPDEVRPTGTWELSDSAFRLAFSGTWAGTTRLAQ